MNRNRESLTNLAGFNIIILIRAVKHPVLKWARFFFSHNFLGVVIIIIIMVITVLFLGAEQNKQTNIVPSKCKLVRVEFDFNSMNYL